MFSKKLIINKSIMEKRKLTCTHFLFPYEIKFVGGLITIAGTGLFFTVKAFDINASFFGWVTISTGLLLFALSKEKIEDEMVDSIRLRSFLVSIIAGFAFVIPFEIIIYISGNYNPIGAIQYICLQLFIYILWFRYELSGKN